MCFVVLSFPLLPRKLAHLVRAFGISEAMQATHAVATVTFVLIRRPQGFVRLLFLPARLKNNIGYSAEIGSILDRTLLLIVSA